MNQHAFLDDRAIRREFFKAYSAAEAGTWAGLLGMPMLSDRETESYKWLGASPIMRKWIGGRLVKGMRQEAYQITNEPYEATIEVSDDDRRRDKHGQLVTRIADMARRAVVHWEKLVTDLLTANGLCYDGQNFFDTDHVSGDSGTQKNALTATEVPAANVTTPANPTAAELANIYLQAIQHMYTLKDETGEPINQDAKQFAVMGPANMMANAKTALTAQFLTTGLSNPAVAADDLSIRWITNPRLTDDDLLYVFRTDGVMRPFILQDEYGIRTGMKDETFENRRMLFGIDASRNGGYAFWQLAASVQLS